MKAKLFLSLFFILTAVMHAQDDVAQQKKIKAISKAACECMYDIDINASKEKKNEEIKKCITTEILRDQLENDILKQLEKAKDTLEKTGIENVDSLTIGEGKNFVVLTDKNYDEIEEYLLRNCDAMEQLLMADNKEYKNSLSSKKKATQYYDEGNKYYAAGQFENAIVAFRKAVKKDKKFAFAWDNLGLTYRKIGNYKEAIKCYKKSLKLDPKGRVPLMNLPIAQSYLKKYKDAIKSYKKMIEIYPDDPEGYYGISRMYLETEDYESALDNAMKSYVIYTQMESPYNKDAQHVIAILYKTMEEKDMMETFMKVAKKYNIKINE